MALEIEHHLSGKVVILPMSAEWRLKWGAVVLGTRHDCRPNYRPRLPWFRGQFATTAAFEEVQPLLDEAGRLLRSNQRTHETV
jgi:hypothetical protein